MHSFTFENYFFRRHIAIQSCNMSFSWDHDHMPSVRSGSPSHYEDFISLLDDVSEPIRGGNVLDLFLTSNPTLVNNVNMFPGIADHDIVISDANIKPKVSKQLPISVPLYRKQTGKVLKLLWRKRTTTDLSEFKTLISHWSGKDCICSACNTMIQLNVVMHFWSLTETVWDPV